MDVTQADNASTSDEVAFPEEGKVRGQKEPGGFWIPDGVIDMHLPVIGPSALAVYCVLCRCTTAKHYPSVGEIARQLGWSSDKVRTLLALLEARELINGYDQSCIRGSRRSAIAAEVVHEEAANGTGCTYAEDTDG